MSGVVLRLGVFVLQARHAIECCQAPHIHLLHDYDNHYCRFDGPGEHL